MARGRSEATTPGFIPSQYGLLQMAQDLTPEAPPRWELGVNYRAVCPEGGRTWSGCPASSEVEPAGSLPKVNVDEVILRAATPFTVYARFSCPPVGWAEGELQSLAERALTRVSSFQVERAFSTGTAGPDEDPVVFPRLQSTTSVFDTEGNQDYLLADAAEVIDATPVNPVQAFVNLEAALADCYKGEGMIHVPAGHGSVLMSESLVRLVSGRWRSANGHTVVFGTGYEGNAPDGTAPADPGVAFYYATGQVWYYRSGVRSFELDVSLDRETNSANMLAERTYVVAYDCCLFAQEAQIA